VADYERAERLTRQLLSSPQKIYRLGGWWGLLEEFWDGYPVENLRPLLRSDEYYVRRAALAIASELGDKVCKVVSEVLPVFQSDEPALIYDALRVAANCSRGEPKVLCELLTAMESPYVQVCSRAMQFVARLASKRGPRSFVAAMDALIAVGEEVHVEGLSYLINADKLSGDEVLELMQRDTVLLRQYGALVAWRERDLLPELVEAAWSIDDEGVQEFLRRMVD
jgi:HEAT repeat protein